MRISIITITRNDGALLKRCLESIGRQQSAPDCTLEHIIVNGNTDGTDADILASAASRGARIINVPPAGVYNALNAGIKAATGDIIGILHGSDVYVRDDVLVNVAACFRQHSPDFIFGDIKYVKITKPGRSFRYYSGEGFTPERLLRAVAPPHPSLFITSRAMDETGPYREDFTIAADFEMFVRLFDKKRGYRYEYLPLANVGMERGGLSGNLYSILVTNTLEKRRALRLNGYNISMRRLLARYIIQLTSRKKR